MPPEQCLTEKSARTLDLNVLADERRRRLLGILSEQESKVSAEQLVTRLCREEQESPSSAASRKGERAIRQDLEHVHLPKLAEAGLVEWTPSSETVGPTDHPVYSDEAFQRFLDEDSAGFDELLSCLGEKRRSVALTVLDGLDEPLEPGELAREIAEREMDGEPSVAAVDEVLLSLHHVHLPKLEAAGLVTVDAESGRVETETVPDVAAAVRDRVASDGR